MKVEIFLIYGYDRFSENVSSKYYLILEQKNMELDDGTE